MTAATAVKYIVTLHGMNAYIDYKGERAYEIDTMSEPTELGAFDNLGDAMKFFVEMKDEPRRSFRVEKACGGFPEGRAMVVGKNVFDEDGEIIDGEEIDEIAYTLDDWKNED